MTPTDTAPTRQILAADIGGTNSRFGHFILSPSGALELVASVWLATASARSFPELLETLADTGFSLPPNQADIAVFAIPGAVLGRRTSLANVAWDVDLDVIERHFNLTYTACVNDFLAQAYGCRLLGNTAETVLPGTMNPERVQAVLGAGTGLGKAALVPLPRGGYLALPSEGGHTAVSFIGEEENAFAAFLCRQTGESYARGDSVLSGSGLVCLHQFLTGQRLSAAEIGASLTLESPTAALFARLYGRAARDFALTVLAAGGVYICGGVAAKNPIVVHHPAFAAEFRNSPTLGPVLDTIPVRLLRNEASGLFGAAHVAQTLLSQAR